MYICCWLSLNARSHACVPSCWPSFSAFTPPFCNAPTSFPPNTFTAAARQAAQDLLAGINMSQLFSQPSSSPQPLRFRHYGMPSPKSSPPSKTSPAANARKRPAARWWERQSTTEIEVTGTVDDVINPSLLTAGKVDAGEKDVAVASLRELWDEERARARAAGGGSQLSAPPGLELADSQDAWAPPEGLLTQDMRGTVDDLARNVIRRVPSASETISRRSSSQIHSQTAQAAQASQALPSEDVQPPMSLPVNLTPVGDTLSQASASVASVSESPANSLSAVDAKSGGDVDQGLFDMLAALRGSQSQRNVEGSQRSTPRRSNTQSSYGPLSQNPMPTPSSVVDQADAIAATQVTYALPSMIE